MNTRLTIARLTLVTSATCVWMALAQGRDETPKERCNRGYYLGMQNCKGIADVDQRWACEHKAKIEYDQCMARIPASVPENPSKPRNPSGPSIGAAAGEHYRIIKSEIIVKPDYLNCGLNTFLPGPAEYRRETREYSVYSQGHLIRQYVATEDVFVRCTAQ